MRRWFYSWRVGVALVTMVILAGCRSSPELKVASAGVTAAIEELDAAARQWTELYRAEVAHARGELERAVIARAVRARIDRLVAMDAEAWNAAFKATGLVRLAEEMTHAEDAARALVRRVRMHRLKDDEQAAAVLTRLVDSQATALKTSAAVLRKAGRTAAADALDAQASVLTSSGTDPATASGLRALLELNTLHHDMPAAVGDLHDTIAALRDAHAIVHRWVMTEVELNGTDVGRIFRKSVEARQRGGAGGGR